MEENKFNPNDWEKVISVEEGEKAQCDRCKQISQARGIGEHIYCFHCSKFIWRLKQKDLNIIKN